jgi:rod shape-determining protein MreC
MNSLLIFLKKIHRWFIFVVLEILSIVMLVSGGGKRNSVFYTSANYIAGKIYDITWRYVGYFYLREENASLMRQLAAMRENVTLSYVADTAEFRTNADTLSRKLKYKYLLASVIKNSVSNQNNFLTLDAGKNKGVKQDMGVISASGVVGIVVAVSDNYSLAISVLNKKIGISAKIKNNNYYGSLLWECENYNEAVLTEIPNHVDIAKGDTVVTSGYSAVFPPEIPIATIETFEKNSEDNFYNITVKFLTDLKCVSNVFIIENLMQEEQKKLEELEPKFVQ